MLRRPLRKLSGSLVAGAAALSLGLALGPAAGASTVPANSGPAHTGSATTGSAGTGSTGSRAPVNAHALAAAKAAIKNLKIGEHATAQRAYSGALQVTGQNQVSTYNWSGYADDNSEGNSYSEVSGYWYQPSVSCTSDSDTELAAFWVGIDGYNSGTVEQDGTLAECYDGSVYYYTWWEMYPSNAIQVVGDSLSPGDYIYAQVVDEGGGDYALQVADYSDSADSFSTEQNCSDCTDSSAEWIAEAPSGGGSIYPLADYGSWSVFSATVTSGYQGVISSFPDDEITMIDSSGNDESVPSGLVSTGDGFTTYWVSST
jgi:Peptidase A4 family